MDNTKEFFTVLSITEGTISDTPVSATVMLERPICNCWLGLTRSYRVASLVFKEEEEDGHSSGTRTSLAGVIDIRRLERQSEGLSESLARVKIKVRTQCRGKVMGSVALEDFLCGLMNDGFIQMGHDGGLILRLLQSPLQALEQSPISTQGLFSEQDALKPKLEVNAATVETPDVVEAPVVSQVVTSTHTGTEDKPEIRHSLDVAGRFLGRLLGPEGCFIEYLQLHHGVTIFRNKRRLHIKGSKDAVVSCLGDIRTLLAEWRRQEAAALIDE